MRNVHGPARLELSATHVGSRVQTSTVVRDGKRITKKTTTTRDAQGNVSTTTEEHEEDAGAAGSRGGFLGFDGGGFGGGEDVPQQALGPVTRALTRVPLVPYPTRAVLTWADTQHWTKNESACLDGMQEHLTCRQRGRGRSAGRHVAELGILDVAELGILEHRQELGAASVRARHVCI